MATEGTVKLCKASPAALDLHPFDRIDGYLYQSLIPQLAFRCTVVIDQRIPLAVNRPVDNADCMWTQSEIQLHRVLQVDLSIVCPAIQHQHIPPITLSVDHRLILKGCLIEDVMLNLAFEFVRRWGPFGKGKTQARCIAEAVADHQIPPPNLYRRHCHIDILVFLLRRESLGNLFWRQVRANRFKVGLGGVVDRQPMEIPKVFLTGNYGYFTTGPGYQRVYSMFFTDRYQLLLNPSIYFITQHLSYFGSLLIINQSFRPLGDAHRKECFQLKRMRRRGKIPHLKRQH